MTISERARAMAEKTADAYSAARYTEAGWQGCAALLFDVGCNDQETEEVLRSKWTRWAVDHSNHSYGNATSGDLYQWLNREARREKMTIKQLATRLVETGN